jgi:hypothetical protein
LKGILTEVVVVVGVVVDDVVVLVVVVSSRWAFGVIPIKFTNTLTSTQSVFCVTVQNRTPFHFGFAFT